MMTPDEVDAMPYQQRVQYKPSGWSGRYGRARPVGRAFHDRAPLPWVGGGLRFRVGPADPLAPRPLGGSWRADFRPSSP